MKILIKNCTLISMAWNRNQIEKNMDILICNDKIVKIGVNICDSVDKVIDATDKVVMPGLINTHMHVPMSFFRETLDGYNLQDWLEKKIWPMEDKLTLEDVYYGSCLSFLEMIRTGTTCGNDMYFMSDAIVKAMQESGIRLQVSRSLMDVDGKFCGENRFNELKDLIKKYSGYERLSLNVGIHGLYTCSPDYIDKCVQLAKDNNMVIHMHYCENQKEVDDIEAIYNDTPINVLSNKFANMKMLLAHCVKLDENDILKLANMDASVSHCPVSNLKLGCGFAKINYMLEHGINVSLGTDGQGSGSNLDLFEVMKYTALLQKGILEDPSKMDSYTVLKMATINGAKALGLDDSIGSIEEGKKADLIIIDMNSLLTKPINNLISQIVYNVKGSDVDTTIIDGKILMENKKLLSNNINKAIFECENIIKRIS